MPGKQRCGEVVWPRLVASKLLRHPLCSHGFVADFLSVENLLDVESVDDRTFQCGLLNNQAGKLKYKLFVSTWNVGGVPPTDGLNLEDWLDTKDNSFDIYVLGFQEMVPLSPKNVLGPEKSWVSEKWNSLIRETLNNMHSNEVDEEKELSLQANKGGSSKDNISHEFRCILSKQMVGIFMSVWIKGDLWPYIHHPGVSCVGCGVMGCLGNKGAVSIRFFVHETSFCFVCCHLASGGKKGDVHLRNSDAMDIFSRTSFSHGTAALDLPPKILDHDRVVLLGDLNYRVSMQEAKTRLLVQQKEWSVLLENDELRSEFLEGQAFEGWNEGPITFSPTYKYYPNSDVYCGCVESSKCNKRRTPAWCDRILWYGKGLKQTRYDRWDSGRLSDHRPVRAVFAAEVEALRSFKLCQN